MSTIRLEQQQSPYGSEGDVSRDWVEEEIAIETAAREAADDTLRDALESELSQKVDIEAGKGLSTNDYTNEDKATLASALQSADIDYTVMTDMQVATNASTTDVILENDKINLMSGAASSFDVPLPVASSSQAGVMNAATYDSVVENTEKIEALNNGTVAIAGLPATPTQAELSAAWRRVTRLPSLINNAAIYDIDNEKKWTYYINTFTWYSTSAIAPVQIDAFTNTFAGIILGSDVDGQVHAETNGTGSVQGWDTVKADIANNTSAIAAKQDKETGKGLSTNDFTDAEKAKVAYSDAYSEKIIEPSGFTTDIPANADLNDAIYRQVGTYRCHLAVTGATILNTPFEGISVAFRLITKNVIGGDDDSSDGMAYRYKVQVIETASGSVFRRSISSDANGVFTYTDWEAANGIILTDTDPGEGASLRPGLFIAVY